MKELVRFSLPAALLAAAALRAAGAEIRFGATRWVNLYEYSRQGRFFATSDYADTGYDYGRLTRGRTGGVFPSSSRPWISSGHQTLFGVTFPNPLVPNRCGMNSALTPPDQFEHWFEDGVPRFDRARIFWDKEVPAPGTWSASIRTPDGALLRLNPDNGRRIHPFDVTTLRFPPTPIKALYIGVKGLEDGLTNNYAGIRDLQIHLHEAMARELTNHLIVAQRDLYIAEFSPDQPGRLDTLQPVNLWQWGPTPVYQWLSPILEYRGQTLEPVRKACPVEVATSVSAGSGNAAFAFDVPETAPLDLTLSYGLSFDIPGQGPADLAVTARFRRAAGNAVEFELRAEALPPDVRVGFRLYGSEQVFGAAADATPVLSGSPIALRTPAGRMAFHLDGAPALALTHAEGLAPARDWNGDPIRWIKLQALADGPALTVGLSLPVGAAGRPQPETLRYAWRPSRATEAAEGFEGMAPFRPADLELLETIDAGDPDDPHVCHDSTNDPAIAAARKKHGPDWRPPGGQTLYGDLPYFDNPREGAVALETIAGERCRVLPDRKSSYFRYDLETRLQPRTVYLVAVEHAFDQLRRGAFHSIVLNEKTEDLVLSRGLYGGFETDPGDPEGGFRTEYVLCSFNGLGWPSLGAMRGLKNSLVFCNSVFSGGPCPWQRVPGLAIRRIRLYRVKTMPALPELAPLLPAEDRQRHVTICTEHDRGSNPWYLFEYPRLMGYSGIWSHNHPSVRFFGGAPTELNRYDQSFTPGTLAGNELLFAAAEEQGLSVNLHLGQLLKFGFEGTDYESFLSATYMPNHIPLQPTREELEHVAAALRNALPKLAKYRSLRDVSTHLWPLLPFTRRNLADFSAATGLPLHASPLEIDNLQALLNAGPEAVGRWQDWACENRFTFHQWLLAELRRHRPDLTLTLTRYWDHGLIEPCLGFDSIPGANRRRLAEAGIVTYVDYLRLFGIEPARYAGRPGFSLEIEAYSRLRTGREVPDYFETGWFRELKAGFDREGLSVLAHCATLEFYVPLLYYNCPFVAPPLEYRKGLIRALLHGNPRNFTLGSYNEPWGPRLADFREFAVAYRLLPFAPPQPYAGTLSDPAGQALIHRYDDRYGLINAGDRATEVTLGLPAGLTAATDMSDGVATPLKLTQTPDGRFVTSLPLKPWALKTLALH